MRKRMLVIAVASLPLLGSCQTNEQTGGLVGALGGAAGGAAIGGAIGHNATGALIGAGVGALGGYLIGSAIGRALDQEERRQLALASELAAEQPVVPKVPPKKVQWKRTDPQTNTVTASGWVVPKSDPYQRDGTTCREVTQNVSKNGQTQSQDVTLCRTQVAQADGSNWVIPQ